MAITFDAGSGSAVTSSVTISWNHTVGAGADRVLYVSIGNSHLGRTHDACTFNGVALTKIASVFHGNDPANELHSIWRMVNPPTGTFSIQASVSGSTFGHAVYGVAGSFAGVHQTTPNDTPVTEYQAAGTSHTLNVPGSAGDTAVLFCFAGEGTSQGLGSGQTLIAQSNPGGTRNSSGSYKTVATNPEPMSASGWASDWSLAAGLALNPATGTAAELAATVSASGAVTASLGLGTRLGATALATSAAPGFLAKLDTRIAAILAASGSATADVDTGGGIAATVTASGEAEATTTAHVPISATVSGTGMAPAFGITATQRVGATLVANGEAEASVVAAVFIGAILELAGSVTASVFVFAFVEPGPGYRVEYQRVRGASVPIAPYGSRIPQVPAVRGYRGEEA